MKKNKGIVDYANSFKILGINFFYAGIIIQTLREERLIEVLLSIRHNLIARIKAPTLQSCRHKIDTYNSGLIILDKVTGMQFNARKQAIIRHKTFSVAGEYGQPGARIVIWNKARMRLFDPYKSKRVFHIHAMEYLGEDNYAVTTGDSKKYLDILRIDWASCYLLHRLEHFGAGYTALLMVDGQLWGGSDFAERSNFIVKLTGGRRIFYLPKNCYGQYVLDIISSGKNELIVFTKKLNSNHGSRVVFSMNSLEFVETNLILINEINYHESV